MHYSIIFSLNRHNLAGSASFCFCMIAKDSYFEILVRMDTPARFHFAKGDNVCRGWGMSSLILKIIKIMRICVKWIVCFWKKQFVFLYDKHSTRESSHRYRVWKCTHSLNFNIAHTIPITSWIPCVPIPDKLLLGGPWYIETLTTISENIRKCHHHDTKPPTCCKKGKIKNKQWHNKRQIKTIGARTRKNCKRRTALEWSSEKLPVYLREISPFILMQLQVTNIYSVRIRVDSETSQWSAYITNTIMEKKQQAQWRSEARTQKDHKKDLDRKRRQSNQL